MRVLIAEDDAVTRRVLQRAIERLGHETLVAGDGLDAWRQLQRESVDVVLSDWVMPGIDGGELCRRVRADANRPYVYFVFLSILEDLDHALVGMRAGADDYLPKPLDQEDLQARLIAAERVTTLHRRLRHCDSERERVLARRESVLRVARQLAAEGEADVLLGQLLAETVAALGVDAAAVHARDERTGRTVRLHATRGIDDAVDPGATDSAVALAVERREPVVEPISVDGTSEVPDGSSGVRIVAPLLHEGRVLGALEIVCEQERCALVGDDLETLELLAGIASAGLVGLERARLSGVMLASRTIQHELNNHLAIASGYAECLATNPTLPPHLREQGARAVDAVMRAAEVLTRLQDLSRIEEADWGTLVPTTIDLAASARDARRESVPSIAG